MNSARRLVRAPGRLMDLPTAGCATASAREHDRVAAGRHVTAPATQHGIPVGRDVLHAVEWGAGRPVVLVHGYTATHGDWLPVVAELVAGGFRVVALDLRGHGQSAGGIRGPVGLDRIAADVRAVLEHLEVRGAVVAGHSLGGLAILAMAADDPAFASEHVRALVPVASSPALRHPPELATIAFSASPVTPWILRSSAIGRSSMKTHVFGRGAPLDAVDDVRLRWAACPLATRWAYAAGTVGADVRPRLGRITVPVVAVGGGADTMCPPSRARMIAQGVPLGRAEVLPGAGHLLPQERPGAVADILRRAAT